MRWILTALLVFSFGIADACEFLVYAKTHWMEGVDRKEWSAEQLAEYDRRLVKGNPIVVKPDGWKWGKNERSPSFVVIKVPDMTVEEGKAYLVEAKDLLAPPDLSTGEQPTKYRKRYQFSVTDINLASSLMGKIDTNKTTFIGKLGDRE